MAASSAGVRAGKAFVELFLDDKAMTRALTAVQTRFTNFASFMAKVGGTLGAAGSFILAPLTKLLVDAAKYGSQIGILSKNLGQTTESISVLAGGAEQAGIGVESFGDQMTELSLKISHAADMNDELIDGLRGLKGRDLMNLGSIDDQLDAIAERIKGIPNAVDRLRAIKDLGLDPKLLKFFEKGKQGLDEMREASKKGGWGTSPEQAAQSQAITQAFTKGYAGVKGILLEVGAALLPPTDRMQDLSQQFQDAAATARKWVTEHKALIVTVAAVGAGLVVAGGAITGLGAAAAIAVPILGVLKLAIAGVYMLCSPVAIGLGLIAAAGAIIGAMLASDGKAIEELQGDFGKFSSWIGESWKGINDALSANDWSLAWKIAIGTADVAWKAFVAGLTVVWVDFKKTFVDGWDDTMTGLRVIINDFAAFMLRNTIGTLRKIVDAFNDIAPSRMKISTDGLFRDSEIDRARDKINDDEGRGLADRKRERDDFRKSQIESAVNALREAMLQLRDLNGKAAAEARDKAMADAAGKAVHFALGIAMATGDAKLPQLPSRQELFEAQRGIFAGPSSQQLAFGDSLGKRQLDAAITTATNTAVLPQAGKDLNALVAAFKFK